MFLKTDQVALKHGWKQLGQAILKALKQVRHSTIHLDFIEKKYLSLLKQCNTTATSYAKEAVADSDTTVISS